VFVSSLRLVNFRSYCDATVSFGAGLNVVVGQNAAGKTNLLEGAWFALRGSSPRTRREEKLITWGARFTRVELELDGPAAGPQAVEVAYAPGQGKRARWNGVEVASQDELRGRTQVFIFVPESLLLVKGSPARRRAHLDAFAAALDTQYAAAARELQAALRQRNAQLLAVKHGAAVSTLDPWDVQFARAAAALGQRRSDLVAELAGPFAAAAAGLAPEGNRFTLQLVSQLAGVDYDESALLDELRARRAGEMGRGLSLFGPHRDDLKFLEVSAAEPADMPDTAAAAAPEPAAVSGSAVAAPACGPVDLPRGGRDLRLFGSQGEQRAAVLALLLAEQQIATARTGEQGTLFLDDVMSELDDARRRLLVRQLTSAGQAIITTTDRHYFVEQELDHATVIELPLSGSLAAGAASPPADAAAPAPPHEDAL
jgi:DNA replication and repair protein RecF